MNRLPTLARSRQLPAAGSSIGLTLWSIAAGVLVPAIVILIGVIATLIDGQALPGGSVPLGQWLSIPVPDSLTTLDPLSQLFLLVVAGLILAALFSLVVWRHRIAADARARRIVRSLHGRLLDQSLRRAEIEGAAAQSVRAGDLISVQLPEIAAGLAMWFRIIPRSVLTVVLCVALALLTHTWLAILAVVTGFILYRWLQRLRERQIGDVSDWEVPRFRDSMADLVGRAPLLARLQTPGFVDQAFEQQTEGLYRRLETIDRTRGRVWPLVFLAIAAATAVFLLGIGVNSFDGDRAMRLPSALVLMLSLGAAVLGVSRLLTLAEQLHRSGDASDLVFHYLQRIGDSAPTEQRVGLGGVREGVRIEDVSLHDSTGRELLSHLSLELSPGSMVAILGTTPISCRTLAELLMGFGRPESGRVVIDNIALRDIHPRALADNVMWIEPDGPLWDGSILDNIRGTETSIHHGQVVDVLQRLDVYERLHRLPEGLSTVVSATDNSLGVETTYAIAVARAVLHRPPIILVSEPPPPAGHLTDDPCLAALSELKNRGSLVVMLPRRLGTLRHADRVVLLHGPRGAGEGTHQKLLAESDLYRHLNYLLFNPYRTATNS